MKIKRTRNTSFANDEYYHIYNRGVDKRNIFKDINDLNRFFQSMKEFNKVEPIGSIYEQSFNQLGGSTSKLGFNPLVEFCLFFVIA